MDVAITKAIMVYTIQSMRVVIFLFGGDAFAASFEAFAIDNPLDKPCGDNDDYNRQDFKKCGHCV